MVSPLCVHMHAHVCVFPLCFLVEYVVMHALTYMLHTHRQGYGAAVDISNISEYSAGGYYYSGQTPTAAASGAANGVRARERCDSLFIVQLFPPTLTDTHPLPLQTSIVISTKDNEYDSTVLWKVDAVTGAFSPLSSTQNYNRVRELMHALGKAST